MRYFFISYRRIGQWHESDKSSIAAGNSAESAESQIVSTLSRQLPLSLARALPALSWSHHSAICSVSENPAEQYFYLQMAIRERWSVRELEQKIDAGLFLRYASVAKDPEKCLPEQPESGLLLPFKDHYVLDFLGLEEQHTETQLRKAMLANVRDLFLEFGREFALVGEEYPLAIGNDTYRIDLLLFHRGLQCLVAVELKSGEFNPSTLENASSTWPHSMNTRAFRTRNPLWDSFSARVQRAFTCDSR